MALRRHSASYMGGGRRRAQRSLLKLKLVSLSMSSLIERWKRVRKGEKSEESEGK